MDKFEASNGRVVGTSVDHFDHVSILFGDGGSGWKFTMSAAEFAALREFFQALRDEELGRWRYPADPRYVVYGGYSPGAEKRLARVINEQAGVSSLFYDGDGYGRDESEIATAYFEAHPERKPWEDAKHEEVWLLTVNGDTGPFLADQDSDSPVAAFVAANGTRIARYDREQITAGRRFYPEVSDAD